MTPLSVEAQRVLSVLRCMHAYSECRAVTDHVIADKASLPKRVIIDASLELLRAGYLVIASCTGKRGRYLIPPGADLRPAVHHAQSLESRGKHVLERARAVRDCIARYESLAGSPGHTLPLFSEPLHAD